MAVRGVCAIMLSDAGKGNLKGELPVSNVGAGTIDRHGVTNARYPKFCEYYMTFVSLSSDYYTWKQTQNMQVIFYVLG